MDLEEAAAEYRSICQALRLAEEKVRALRADVETAQQDYEALLDRRQEARGALLAAAGGD